MKNELQLFFEQPKDFNDLEYNISYMNNLLYLYKQVEPNFHYRLLVNDINIGDNLTPDMTYMERFNFKDMAFEINYNNPYCIKINGIGCIVIYLSI